MDNKSFVWRIWFAVVLTSMGVFYYLVFLFYLCGGIPIEKIHYYMTDGWPNFCADNVPLVAPGFLILGLYFWYSYTVKAKPKPVVEPEYAFEFTKVDKHTETHPAVEPEYIFESNRNKKAHQADPILPLEDESDDAPIN